MEFEKILDRSATSTLKWEKYSGSDILPMWLADMEFKTAPAIVDAIKARVDHGIFGYTLAPKQLDSIICTAMLRDYEWKIEEEWLVWLPGVVAGLSACARAFGSDGDEIIVNPPIYHHFLSVIEPARKRRIRVPLRVENGRWIYDLNAIERAINQRTSMIMLCSPHNPVGTAFHASELHDLVSLCQRHELLIISDEIHCGLILDKDRVHRPTAKIAADYKDNIVTLMSPSKTFNLAGINASFAVIPNLRRRKQFINACKDVVPMVSILAYTAALAAYRDGMQWQVELCDYLRGNRDYLHAEINSLGQLSMGHLEATYLAWIDIRKLDVEDPIAFFERAGVGLSGGSEFGDANYIRLNFACSREQLEEGVERIRKAL